ncbi:hypothetical protein C8D88_107266 [Lentzea atacamensis]|uniref:Uncharacterized protein n=1 Tax=Lentzea atacamensis TaxID=531938 RepID=A0A316HY33_9PSEU|nr:hypothetical protein C8D88_107266 [Lentzea atacamensis]
MAKPVHNTLSAFESFDDRPALFDSGVEFTYRERRSQRSTGSRTP